VQNLLLTGLGRLVRIVAARTLFSRVVLARVNPLDLRPLAGGISKVGMTPGTQLPASVNGELRRVRGVFKGRTMAVFALDDLMGRRKVLLLLVGMAVSAVLFSLEFRLDRLPLSLVPFAIPAVHVPAFLDAEIFGHHEGAGDKYDSHDCENQIEGPENMHGIGTLSTMKIKSLSLSQRRMGTRKGL
jgi:hypothetical protein